MGEEDILDTSIALNPAERAYYFLEKSGSLELLSEKDKFEGWLQNLNFEQAMSYLTRINGLVRGESIKDRGLDGENVRITSQMGDIGFLPMAEKDKEEALEDTLIALKSVKTEKDRGALAYLSIQAIHPFEDGNGRTGRLLFYLLSNVGIRDALSKEKIYEIISHDESNVGNSGRAKIEEIVKSPKTIYNYINYYYLAEKFLPPNFLSRYGRAFSNMASGSVDVDTRQLSSDIRAEFNTVIADTSGRPFSCRDLALTTYLSRHNLLEQYEVTEFGSLPIRPATYFGLFDTERYYNFLKGEGVLSDEEARKIVARFKKHGDQAYRLDTEKLLPQLRDDQAKEIIGIFKEIKVQQVKGMIDIISNPDEYKLGDGLPIKEAFYT